MAGGVCLQKPISDLVPAQRRPTWRNRRRQDAVFDETRATERLHEEEAVSTITNQLEEMGSHWPAVLT